MICESKWKHPFNSPEYRAWASARNRCHNPKDPQFHRYGGRGIFMCERWRDDFNAFIDDMGLRPAKMSLERIDNNQGYDPFNCVWATLKEQSHNRRNNIRIGDRMLLEVAKEKGIEYATMLKRFHSGRL